MWLRVEYFNSAAEKVVRETKIESPYINLSVQLPVYSDDSEIIKRDIEQCFLSLEVVARKVGLTVNRDETKYVF